MFGEEGLTWADILLQWIEVGWKLSKLVSTFDDVIEILKCLNPKPKIVAIDGDMGVGKSKLSREIADNYNSDIFELDSYLKQNITETNGYEDSICYDYLLHDIKDALSNGVSVVVEGLCIQNVLKNIGLTPDFKIYVDQVKLLKASGEVYSKSSDIVHEDIPEILYPKYEIKNYHIEKDPCGNADIVCLQYV